jgi:NtrC-family two-component system sensor histidine kinase KinB
VSLRGKLIIAQIPLALALVVVGIVGSIVIKRLGAQSRLMVADNLRSVVAIQKMKDVLERMDQDALSLLVGGVADAESRIEHGRETFARELRLQETNITEAGEEDLTRRLRAAWSDHEQQIASYLLRAAGERRAAYFSSLALSRGRVVTLTEAILGLNEDAMLRKSRRGEARARQFEQVNAVVLVLALSLGILASGWITTRVLRPLGVVGAAVRRFGEGDLKARADLQGGDEIAALAGEFNRMAERLARYRASSLGELLQAQRAAQAAIDALPDPVLLLDGNGQLQGANAAAASQLGIDPDGEPAAIFAGADPGVRAVIDRLRGFVLSGKGAYVPRGFEEAVRVGTPEGERIFLPRAAPLYGESGAVAGAAVVLQDATRLFRFDELKNNLVATVAHEFRTPLTSLRMALHLCTEGVAGPLTTKQADLLSAARDDCERLQVIVDELLNLSRIESGRIDLHRRRSDPETLVNLAVEVHRAAAEQARVALRTEVLPGLPEVFVDPDRLHLVFANLLSNAIRYAPAGTDIVVRARPDGVVEGVRDHRLAGPTHIRFEVLDQGAGIPGEHQSGLFEKFFRVPGSPEGGSGLGLFISKGLVQAHGGKIGLSSQVGRGATFWFTIPVAPPSS